MNNLEAGGHRRNIADNLKNEYTDDAEWAGARSKESKRDIHQQLQSDEIYLEAKRLKQEGDIKNKVELSEEVLVDMLTHGKVINKKSFLRMSIVDLDNGLEGVFKSEDQIGLNAAKQEVAAYSLSKYLNFDLVPPTVLRNIDGLEGSLQKYVSNPIDLSSGSPANPLIYLKGGFDKRDNTDFLKLALFDFILWSTDRHINLSVGNLILRDKLYAIDNEAAFISEGKSPMEYWDAALKKLPPETMDYDLLKKEMQDLSAIVDGEALSEILTPYLSKKQIDACLKRIQKVIEVILQGGGVDQLRGLNYFAE